MGCTREVLLFSSVVRRALHLRRGQLRPKITESDTPARSLRPKVHADVSLTVILNWSGCDGHRVAVTSPMTIQQLLLNATGRHCDRHTSRSAVLHDLLRCLWPI